LPSFFAARLPWVKRLGQAARAVQRAVHGVEQRQIAQLGTTVNVALRNDADAPLISWTSCTSGYLKMLNGLSDEKISPNQKHPHPS
jgi:hypothetical protein